MSKLNSAWNNQTKTANGAKTFQSTLNPLVDFYYKGSDKYDGIDWRGMRLVFDEYQGRRYLVAIINDRWTV